MKMNGPPPSHVTHDKALTAPQIRRIEAAAYKSVGQRPKAGNMSSPVQCRACKCEMMLIQFVTEPGEVLITCSSCGVPATLLKLSEGE